MLTKEQIRTKGTEIPYFKGAIPYTTVSYLEREGKTNLSNPSEILDRPVNKVVFGVSFYKDIEFILVDSPGYSKDNHFAIDIKELQKAGIVEPDKKEFKAGDKVKIPKTKQGRCEGIDWDGFQDEMKGYNLDYMVIGDSLGIPNNIPIDRDDAGHVSWNSFSAEDLEPYDSFVLPEKWSIQGGDALFYSGFEQWTEGHGSSHHWGGDNAGHYYNYNGEFIAHTTVTPTYPVITLDQFKQYILKQSKTDTMLKKIIGYELIEAYPNWETLGIQLEYQSGNAWYMKNTGTSNGVLSPEKHPRFWKPIFEEDIKVGDWAIAIHPSSPSSWSATAFEVAKVGNNSGSGHYIYNKAGNNGEYKNFRKATPEEIEVAKKKNEVSIAGYKAEKATGGGIKFGCKQFTKEDIIVVSKLVNDSEIGAEIVIGGQRVTPEIIAKLFTML